MAQWEREEIGDRISASIAIRAKLGKPLGGRAPFGYRWEDKKLVPDPTEAPVRKLMHELYVEHHRRKTVARILNEAGYRTRSGDRFSDTTVSRLLRDPVSMGQRRTNCTTRQGDNGEASLKPEEEWVHLQVEPIVSEGLWLQCNHIMDKQSGGKRTRVARKTANLFSGLAYCGCGNKMYVPSNSPKYTCSKCRNKIGTEDLDEIFHEQLKSFFFSPEEVTNYLGQADQVVKDKEELLRSLAEEERKIRQEMDKVYRLYTDDVITPSGFGERYKPLEERLTQMQEGIPEMQAEIDFLKVQYLSSDQMLHEARDLYSRWPELTPEDKRKIVESITERITIENDEVTINLCYLPSSSEMATTEQHIPPVTNL
jgi:site-specific DNA recombinase